MQGGKNVHTTRAAAATEVPMADILVPLAIIALSLFLSFRRFKGGSRGMGFAWLACALFNGLYLVRILLAGGPAQ